MHFNPSLALVGHVGLRVHLERQHVRALHQASFGYVHVGPLDLKHLIGKGQAIS